MMNRIGHENSYFRKYLKITLVMFFYVYFISVVHAGEMSAGKSTSSCRPSWMPESVPDLCEWNVSTSLPNPRAYPSAVVFSDKIYVAGGFSRDASKSKVVYYNDVLMAPIKNRGEIGNWSQIVKFEQGRSGQGMAVVNDCLFIVGGSWLDNNKAIYANDVQIGRLTDDGQTLKFSKSPNHLNTPRSNHALLAFKGEHGAYLYAIAGVTQIGNDTVHLDTIEYAAVDNNCNVGPWSPAHFDIKGGRSTPQALLIGNHIYVMGGWGDLDLIDIYNDIQYTSIRGDGSLSPWQTSSNRLPTGIYGHSSLAIPLSDKEGTMLMILGGQPSTGVYSNAISYAYIIPNQLPSNSVGPWAMYYRMLPQEIAGHVSLYNKGFLYLIGGSQSGGRYMNDVIFTRVNPGNPE